MKMYLDESQTAKLMELGLPKPSSIASVEPIYGMGGISVAKAYSIGELIEMLPKKIEMSDDETGELEVSFGFVCMVYYTSFGVIYYDIEAKELIDALYVMILKLKEEGVI